MTEYKSEQEFLANYNSDEFEKLSMTTDICIFSVSNKATDNYRKLGEKKLSVLLAKRTTYPFIDMWCLPGGFVEITESIDDAAKRILRDETNLENIYLEQLYTFGEVNRDPRMRIISASYVALIDQADIKEELADNTDWFELNYEAEGNLISFKLTNDHECISFKVKKHLKCGTSDRYEYEVIENTALAFDHAKVIMTGLERIKNKCEYTDIIFNMMPKYFTLGELQQVYEVVLNKKLLDPAFRRIIASKVEKTDKKKTGGGHRPSALFKHNKERLSCDL